MSSIAPVGAAVAGAPLGLALLLALSWRTLGDIFFPFTTQWQPQWKGEAEFFVSSDIRKMWQIGELGYTPDFYYGLFVIGALALAIYSVRTLSASASIYALVALALGASTRNYIGIERLVMQVMPPLVWALSVLGRRRTFDRGWRGLSPVLMGAFGLLAGRWAMGSLARLGREARSTARR